MYVFICVCTCDFITFADDDTCAHAQHVCLVSLSTMLLVRLAFLTLEVISYISLELSSQVFYEKKV